MAKNQTLQEIEKNQTLQDLTIELQNNIRQELYTEGLSFSLEDFQHFAEALKKNISLKRLIFDDCECFSDEVLNFLAEALKHNKTLKILHLYRNFSDVGLNYLAEALKINNGLEELEIDSENVTDQGIIYIANSLHLNKNLKNLTLYDNSGFTVESFSAIAEALKNNNTLEALDIDSIYINDIALEKIASALKINKGLQLLDISETDKLTDEGLKNLSEALITNKTLASLTLYSDSFTNVGFYYLAEAIKKSSSLIDLTIGAPQVSHEGLFYIARALSTNPRLEVLDIGHIKFIDVGVNYLSEALLYNTNLKVLTIDPSLFSISGIGNLVYIIKFNSTLTSLNFMCHNIIIPKEIENFINYKTQLNAHTDLPTLKFINALSDYINNNGCFKKEYVDNFINEFVRVNDNKTDNLILNIKYFIHSPNNYITFKNKDYIGKLLNEVKFNYYSNYLNFNDVCKEAAFYNDSKNFKVKLFELPAEILVNIMEMVHLNGGINDLQQNNDPLTDPMDIVGDSEPHISNCNN